MAATDALIELNKAVNEYLLGYKKTTEDAFIYVKHACDCVRDFHLYDSPNVVTEKIAISALGIIEMPPSMIGFNGLFMPIEGSGEYWPFTRKDTIVNTTTTTLGVEGHDTHFGEGDAVQDPKSDTYGGVGGVNDYYYLIDWKARRIFCEGVVSDTVVLRYTTSGVEVGGTTYIPSFICPLINDYLLWKECFFIPGLERYADQRARTYEKTEMRIRNLINAMTADEWRDLLLSITTQSPVR
jgi:hypothetical protein